MTEKGKRYVENKRVLRHKAKSARLGVGGAEMSIHPTSSRVQETGTNMSKIPISYSFLNTDLGIDNLQNDTPAADL